MPGPKIKGYDNVKFDRKRAQERLNAICDKNPNLTNEQIEMEMRKIVALESLYANRLEFLKKIDERMSDPSYAQEKMKDIEDGLFVKRLKGTLTFFNEYAGSRLEDILVLIQNSIPEEGPYENIIHAENGIINSFHGITTSQQIYQNVASVGAGVDLAMFKPVTDASKIQQLGSAEEQERVDKWQEEADAIKINIPDELNEDLISFAVFGNLMRNENLEKAHEIVFSKKGSTLYKVINTAETMKASYFQNLIKNDERINMHATRAIVPQCRENVKDMVDRGDMAGLKADITNAFNILFHGAQSTSPKETQFIYCVTRMEALVEGLKKKNISPIDIGISAEYLDKLPILYAKKEIVMKKNELTAKLGTYYEGYKFTNEEKYDVLKNPELKDIIADIVTCNTILDVVTNEVQAMEQQAYFHYNSSPEILATRPFTQTEKMLSVNLQAAFKTFKERVIKGDALQQVFNAAENDNLNKESLYCGSAKVEKVYKGNQIFYYELFETRIADGFFKDFTDFLDKNADAMAEKIQYKIDSENNEILKGHYQDMLESLPTIVKQIERINLIRFENKGVYTPEYEKKIAEEYQRLYISLKPICLSGLEETVDQKLGKEFVKFNVPIASFAEAFPYAEKTNEISSSLQHDFEKNDIFGLENPIIEDLAFRFRSLEKPPRELSDVKESFIRLCSKLSPGEEDIGTEETEEIEAAFNDYFSKVKEFLQKSGDKVPLDFKIALRDSLIPFESYSKGIEAGKKRNDVLADTSWISNLFIKDNNNPIEADPIEMPEHKNPEGNEFINSGYDEYKEIAKRSREAYKGYLSKVCGVEDNPFETLDYRFGLIQKILDTIPSYEGDGPAVIPFAEKANQSIKYEYDFLNFKESNVKESYLLGSYFIESQFNSHSRLEMSEFVMFLSDKIQYRERHGIKNDVVTFERITKALGAFKFQPESVGLNEEKLKHIRTLTPVLSVVKELRSTLKLIKDNKGRFYVPLAGLDNDRAEFFLTRINDIENAYFDYLGGRTTELPDKSTVMNEIIDALGDDLKNPECYLPIGEDASVYPQTTLDSLNFIAEVLPSYAEKITEKLADARKSMPDYFEQSKEDFINLKDEMYDEMSKVKCAKDVGFVSGDLLFRYQSEYLFACAKDREFTLEKLKASLSNADRIETDDLTNNLKQFLLGKHFAHELSRIEDGYDPRYLTAYAPGKEIKEIYDVFCTQPKECTEKLKEHIDRFFNRPGIKRILEMDPKEISKLMESKDLDTKLAHAAYGKDNIISDISESSRELFEEGLKHLGVLPTKNSPLFQEVRHSLREITAKYHNMDDPAPAECKRLYNACKKYIENREPDASSDIGKKRFKAVAEIMVKLGMRLRDKLPEMRMGITNDLRDLAVRSQESSDMIKGIQTNRIASKAKAAILKGDTDTLTKCVTLLMSMKEIIEPQKMKPFAEAYLKALPDGGLKNMAVGSKEFTKDFTSSVDLFVNMKKYQAAKDGKGKNVNQNQGSRKNTKVGPSM